MYTQKVYSAGKSFLLWRGSPLVAFFVVNGAIVKCWSIYCLLVCASMSAVLFAVMNLNSSFSAEKTENDKIAAELILAHVAVCVRMCVPIGENIIRVAG